MVGRVFRASLLVSLGVFFAVSVTAQCLAPSFDAGINLAAGGSTIDIASADFNADGKTDFVIPHFNTISVFFGTAIGAPNVVKLTSVQNPNAVGAADFNHDGKMDIAVSSELSFASYSLLILLGDGAGGFGSPTSFPVNVNMPLVVADFNNDNNADVFLGNASTNNSQVLLGNGSGGFGTPFSVVMNNNTQAVAADFNHDGKIDLATAYDVDFISLSLGDGTGHFSAAVTFPVSRGRFISAGDFNRDGNLDLATVGQSDGVSILLGNGAGSFGTATSFSTGFQALTVAVADFNGDGKSDLVTTGGRMMATLAGDGNGGFGPHTDYALNGTPIDIVVGDFNGDSKVDVTMANGGSNTTEFDTATVFFGDGGGRLRYPLVLTSGLSPFSITHGDLNHDGRADLAVANISHNSVSIWLSAGVGGFSGPVNFAVGNQPRSVALADLNNDQKLDLVTANFAAGTISILLGNGQGAFSSPLNLSVPGFNPDYVAIGDFNNDGKPDLAVAYLNANSVSILLGDGVGGFSLAGNFPVPFGAASIAINDFNGDGKSDIAVANISGVSVLLGNGSGGFGVTNTIETNSTAYSVAVGDFNGDGNADLATALGNIDMVLVHLGNGQGGFGAPSTFKAGSSPFSVTVSDFNGDGNADLATGNGLNTASVLANNGNGGFAPAVSYLTAGGITRSISSSDFNSDGRSDLALADQGGTVRVVFNSCSAPPFSAPTLSVTDATITEADAGTTNLSFGISLSAAANKPVTVSFYSAAQNASKDLDYQTSLGRVTFAPGITSQTITIPIIGDTLDEFDEQFSIFLVNPLNANISDAQGLGMILDNDPPPRVSINDMSITEGNSGTSGASFTVSLSAPSGKPISLSYTTSDQSAVAGSDYQAQAGTVTFNPGETTKTIGVPVLGDILDEPDETFLVNLNNLVNVTAGDLQGLGTILDNDPPPAVSINDASTSEGNSGTSVAIFTVSLSAPSGKPISLSYTTADQSAVAGADYQAVTGTAAFSPGETTKTIAITVLGDILAEPNETFFVNLSNLANVTAADSQGLGTIIDDDPLLLLTLENTSQAAALESVSQTRDPFPLIIPFAFHADRRTRVSLFVGGLQLLPNENASAVTVEAEDEQGRRYDLAVEFVGTVPCFSWLTQIVVKLPEEVVGAPRDLWLKVSLRGAISNRATIKIGSP